MTIDTKALTHILFNAYDYPSLPLHAHFYRSRSDIHPSCFVSDLPSLAGIVIAEGNEHRRQRKVMSPAFSHSHILQFHDIFLEKATQIWTSECVKSSGKAQIDTVSYLSRLTLDIMALTGFNFKTDTLNAEDTPNKVHQAICELLRTAKEIQTMRIFSAICPILRWIPNEGRARIQATHETLAHDLGRQLLAEAKMGDTNESSVNDLFSLLARANGSPDVPIDQRMSEADVLSRIAAVTWSLYFLCRHPRVQKKLREELLATSTDTPTVDEMNALPYLDWVIRETLRVNPPVPSLARVAGKDDVIPLRQPFKDTRGRLHDSIPIMKGELIIIPTMAINRDKGMTLQNFVYIHTTHPQPPSFAMASFASSSLYEQRSRVAVNNLRRRHVYGRVLFEDRNSDCSVSDLEHPNGSLAHPAFTSTSFHSPKAKTLDTRIASRQPSATVSPSRLRLHVSRCGSSHMYGPCTSPPSPTSHERRIQRIHRPFLTYLFPTTSKPIGTSKTPTCLASMAIS
ncbi:uncharacterized protein ARMOST_08182 [Armillaria ostoyae]|uniref:Cytochrome P450 n=1 Tax=Armillaria ostoyae TaxID=47428 RepID=A0A284R7V3_ARMOS|nr:uncharacterized protein ARMOST_08182 [Armillaria ostoyae]